MPSTSEFAIPYPCEGAPIGVSDFAAYALAVEGGISSVSTQANGTLARPAANVSWTSNPAFAVETTVTFSASPLYATGITVNAGAGTLTTITPGPYLFTVSAGSNQSTLTFTSQRISVAVNGTNQYIKKFQGRNPSDFSVMAGFTEGVLFLNAGDVVTSKYLWTGTGALSNPAFGRLGLYLLATP